LDRIDSIWTRILVLRKDVNISQDSFELFNNNEGQLSKNSKEIEGMLLRIFGTTRKRTEDEKKRNKR